MTRRLSGHRLLAALVVVAIALRVTFLAIDPLPAAGSGLTTDHTMIAHNIVHNGHWFYVNRNGPTLAGPDHQLLDPRHVDWSYVDEHPDRIPLILEMPGVGAAMAATWELTGREDYYPLQVLQLLLDSLCVVLVFSIAMRLFASRRAAWTAAVGYALFLPVAYQTKFLHTDAWASVFAIAILAAFLRVREKPDATRRLVALGVVTGAGMYFRAPMVLLPLGLGVALVPELGWRRALRCALVPALVAALIIAPWTIRNAITFDRLIAFQTGSGQGLWEGLGEIDNDFGAVESDDLTFRQVHRVRPDLVYQTPEYDSYLLDKAKDAIRDHPGHYVKLLGRRLALSTFLYRNTDWLGSPHYSDVYDDEGRGALVSYLLEHPWLLPIAALASLAQPLLFLIAIVVMALTWRQRRREHAILIAYAAVLILPFTFLHLESRYVVPASTAWLLLLGLGVDEAWRRGRGGRQGAAPC